ncbi:MAG TPA: SRPBCC domain-containing protein [Clostridia bacterium]|nr:SRPBCC domain-containing protein [Clostridia bacterium]
MSDYGIWMREINTDIVIRATAERVWQVLTDFGNYPAWNPFILSVDGSVSQGARLKVRIHPPGGRPMLFRPTLLRVEPFTELRWRGRLLLPGIFDGEHIFQIMTLKDGLIRFIQREAFSGILVPLLWKTLNLDTRRGFNEMNAALKTRVETTSDNRIGHFSDRTLSCI